MWPFARRSLALSLSLALAAAPAMACDLCAVYSAQLAQGQGGTGWYAGISEQYSVYDELRSGRRQLQEDGGQYLRSSNTQLLLGFGIDERWSLQLNLPYLQRDFKRLEHDGSVDRGSATGIGDMTLLAQYLAWRHDAEDRSFVWRLLGGVKLPTGDSNRLGEELDEEHGAAAKHEGAIPSGVHGHDLALGSGSTDLLLGSSMHGRNGRWTYIGEIQYALRRQGDFDYQIGNDLQWSVAAGRYLVLDDEHSWALQLVLTGEHKHHDELAGERLDDTRQRTLAIGPQVAATFGSRYALEARIELPLEQDVSAIQISQGWRLRGAFVARF
jgi:opacity protein-like surface antigen